MRPPDCHFLDPGLDSNVRSQANPSAPSLSFHTTLPGWGDNSNIHHPSGQLSWDTVELRMLCQLAQQSVGPGPACQTFAGDSEKSGRAHTEIAALQDPKHDQPERTRNVLKPRPASPVSDNSMASSPLFPHRSPVRPWCCLSILPSIHGDLQSVLSPACTPPSSSSQQRDYSHPPPAAAHVLWGQGHWWWRAGWRRPLRTCAVCTVLPRSGTRAPGSPGCLLPAPSLPTWA